MPDTRNPPKTARTTFAEAKAFFADHEAAEWIEVWHNSRNGMALWRAFQVYRRYKLPIPEPLLVAFDGLAENITRAKGAREIAAALWLTGDGGGPRGATQAKSLERRMHVVRLYRAALAAGFTPGKAAQVTAKACGMTPGNVKTIYSNWRRKESRHPEINYNDPFHLARRPAR